MLDSPKTARKKALRQSTAVETKAHIIGTVHKGIIGMTEGVNYPMTATVLSQEARLYRIDRGVCATILKGSVTWNALIDKQLQMHR